MRACLHMRVCISLRSQALATADSTRLLRESRDESSQVAPRDIGQKEGGNVGHQEVPHGEPELHEATGPVLFSYDGRTMITHACYLLLLPFEADGGEEL